MSNSLEKDQIFEYFKKPDDADIESYLKYHPNQPSDVPGGLPFASRKAYFPETNDKRQWVSYCEEEKSLYCYICLMFFTHNDSGENTQATKKIFIYF